MAAISRIHSLAKRIVWVIFTAPVLLLFAASIPDRAQQLLSPCSLSNDCARSQLTWTDVTALKDWGLTLKGYTYYILSLEVVFALGFFLIAASILWNRPRDWLAIFTALMLLTLGVCIFPTITAQEESLFFMGLLQFFSSSAILLFAYLFPDGRFVPHWTKILAIPWLLWLFIHNLLPDSPLNIARDSLFIELLIALAFYSTGLLAQIYRYKWISTPTQRQQAKWVIFGCCIAFFGFAAYWITILLLPLNQGQEFSIGIAQMVSNTVYALTMTLIPITIALSIQHHHLWEIDSIINRSLVYGLLTIVLTLFYSGSVILLQNLMHNITEQNSELAVIGSTLTTAALFSPLRLRIQNTIDMRFYRQKYSAERILGDFSRILKAETDIAVLSDRLEQVVEITLQPKFVSLWLYQEKNDMYKKEEE